MARRRRSFASVTGKKKFTGSRARSFMRKMSVEVKVFRAGSISGYNATACIKRRGTKEIAGKTALSRCGGSYGAKTASAAVKAALYNLATIIKK